MQVRCGCQPRTCDARMQNISFNATMLMPAQNQLTASQPRLHFCHTGQELAAGTNCWAAAFASRLQGNRLRRMAHIWYAERALVVSTRLKLQALCFAVNSQMHEEDWSDVFILTRQQCPILQILCRVPQPVPCAALLQNNACDEVPCVGSSQPSITRYMGPSCSQKGEQQPAQLCFAVLLMHTCILKYSSQSFADTGNTVQHSAVASSGCTASCAPHGACCACSCNQLHRRAVGFSATPAGAKSGDRGTCWVV